MAKAKRVNGKDLMLWINGKVVALSKSCGLNIAMATVDASSKDDGIWDVPEAGNMSWNSNNESLYSADKDREIDVVYDDLFELFAAGVPVDVSVGIPSNVNNDGLPVTGWAMPEGVYKGKALITALDLNGAKGDSGSVTVSLTGHGKLEKV